MSTCTVYEIMEETRKNYDSGTFHGKTADERVLGSNFSLSVMTDAAFYKVWAKRCINTFKPFCSVLRQKMYSIKSQ